MLSLPNKKKIYSKYIPLEYFNNDADDGVVVDVLVAVVGNDELGEEDNVGEEVVDVDDKEVAVGNDDGAAVLKALTVVSNN